MKKLEVGSLDLSGKISNLEHIFDNMHSKSDKLGQAGYLLGGDTGVGKTSFVREMGSLLGLELIIIETPHIVEEHIIDIPFIVVQPNGASQSSHLHVDTKTTEFDIEVAKSNLYTQLQKAKKSSDSELLKRVNATPELFMLWEKLGGDATTIPDEIADIRSKFKAILFLDEYFRQTSSTIRNMLRSILNGRIGSNELPHDVYTIFASNLVDQGVGDILENEDFRIMDFDTPSTDEWFAYLLSKFSKDKKIKLDDDLMHAFYKLLQDNEGSLSSDDFDADVRVSPRRWEQLLLYINASLPVKDQADADLLLKNVEVNFKHYATGDKAAIAEAVLKTVKKLIKDQSNITADEKSVDDSDWREVLKHQIEVKMKLGNARKYIPVIGGLPGAGKTKHITDLATDLNLVPVFIDVQNLSPEEVIGTPLGTRKSGSLEVHFSKPALWDDIQRQMKKGEANLEERLTHVLGKIKGAAEYKKWHSQEVKYMIFFDELNRTNTKVFNAIRKVLLEKEFTPEYKLPEDSVLVAAINPTGKGTQELTKHVRDVFDVIPVGVSWVKFKKHLDSVDLKVEEPVAVAARQALGAFVERFRSRGGKIDNADPHFYLNLGSTPLYISAREYTDTLVNVSRSMQRTYKKEMQTIVDDPAKAEATIRKVMAKAFMHSIDYIVRVKHGVEAPELKGDMMEWFESSDDINLGPMFKRKVESVKSLSSLLSKPFEDKSKHLFDDLEFVNYITSVDPVTFKEELQDFLVNSVYKDFDDAFANFGSKKTMNPSTNAVQVEKEEVSKIVFITHEILHAIKAHDVSNKMVDLTKQALRGMLVKLAEMNTDDVQPVMTFNRDITIYIKKLFA